MELKEYNRVQSSIIRKYNLECLVTQDSIRFFSIMSAFSLYRKEELKYHTIKSMIKELKKYL